MPIFTMIFTFIGLLFACILDKGIILGIVMVVGIGADAIFWAILITKDKSDTGFSMHWDL